MYSNIGHRLFHGGGHRLRRTHDAMGKSSVEHRGQDEGPGEGFQVVDNWLHTVSR